ncbi:MAG: hypothetical protein R3F19_28625 [Verrucomicrobiales bacterium]
MTFQIFAIVVAMSTSVAFAADPVLTALEAHDQAVHVMDDEWMQEPCIYRHGGTYFLTCTRLDNSMGYSQGIEIWSSSDLTHWQSLGMPWTFFRSSWLKELESEAQKSRSELWLRALGTLLL